ncbi:hypothetical protein CPC08DRAFT_766583 [Agrocybe pediades]|nr:hypothetical protein CPC08DRAFT_766583 [Agrocybe pediades]
MASRPGWHRGEDAIHAKLGYDQIENAVDLYKWIMLEMPDEEARFYSSKIQYLPMCILDNEGRPWVSVLAREDGQIGYIHYPARNTLQVEATLWDGDPFVGYFEDTEDGQRSPLFASVGIEVSTRTRNKFAGRIEEAQLQGKSLKLTLKAAQAIGNCPKYITIRDLHPHSNTACAIRRRNVHMGAEERLPDDVIQFILSANSSILGTVYEAPKEDASVHPSHLGANHRGGKPGFLRVKPSDGRTIVLPDYSGDRIMTSLGNIEVTPLAALTIISFDTGDILYITGRAKNIHGDEARAIMPLQNLLTEIYVTGYTFVRDAFPARQAPGVPPQPSPYDPPLRYLAEEEVPARIFARESQSTAKLIGITLHTPTIATFEWETSAHLHIVPGQAVIMDLGSWLGKREFRHIHDEKPSLVNDDFIRSWTVSSFSPSETAPRRFSVTLREKQDGAVTVPLFKLAREAAADPGYVLPKLKVNVVGISGDFILPRSLGPSQEKIPVLWIAGGIGVTPFLPMLSSLSRSQQDTPYDITFIVSTREPNAILQLILSALDRANIPPWLSLHIYATTPCTIDRDDGLYITQHQGRLHPTSLEEHKNLLASPDLQTFICGPEQFQTAVIAALGTFGVDKGRIRREGFSY